MSVRMLHGDCRTILPTLAAESVQCVVTSPPYWGLRDYGTASWEGGEEACDHIDGVTNESRNRLSQGHGASIADKIGTSPPSAFRATVQYRDACGKCGARRVDSQLGLEPTPEAYVAAMVDVFREVRRVLRDDGTLWLNMGDGYATRLGGDGWGSYEWQTGGAVAPAAGTVSTITRNRADVGLKPKDLVGMPWRLAFALQADGWFLRADIIWAKPNPMPESVTDRPTKAHEYIFLLSKAARYFYDADAVREPSVIGESSSGYHPQRRLSDGHQRSRPNGANRVDYGRLKDEAGILCNPAGRNLRSVWTIPSAPFPDAHFATFPPALASRCIQAGTSERGCCAACGAPWERVVERSPSTAGQVGNAWQEGRATANHHGPSHPGTFIDASAMTIGWQPSCACDAPVMPCTVLDCFGGSGTVGAVAEQLGRHSILIELSAPYVEMAKQRTAQLGLFTWHPPRPSPDTCDTRARARIV